MRRLAATSRHHFPHRRRALFLEQLEDRRVLATFTVNTVADTVDADPGITSLREAITAANSQADDDIIDFSTAGTINLTGALPDLNSNIEIYGPGADNMTVRRDTGGDYRIFTVAGGTIVLDGMTISNGIGLEGGGIRNAGELTVSNSLVSGNYTGNFLGGLGGGIYNGGSLTVSNSTLSGNGTGQGAGSGGAIYNVGVATINNSTLSSNSGGNGGGIYNSYGWTVVSNSTLSHNFASFYGGGGIYNYVGGLEVSNSTLSANSAWGYGGGGIFNAYGSLEVSNSTISENNGGDGGWGGGIAGDGSYPTLNNTIVANNLGGDIFDSFTGSNNLFGSVDLGPLQDNGGPTHTHALPADSPAINAGSNALVPAGVTSDQRGLPRFAGMVDIGAFEFQPPVQTVTVDIRPESLNIDSNGTLSVVIFGAADFNAAQIDVGSVRFAGAGVWQSTLTDVNHDGHLDLQVKFRTQDTILDQIYADLLLDDEDADGILDSTRQSARVEVTGQTLDDALFSGSDNISLFLAGRSLRNLLDELFGG